MYIWKTSRLVEDLAKERVPPRDKMLYLLTGTVAYLIFTYIPLLSCAKLNLLYLTEFTLLVAIAVIGILKSYHNNGGPKGDRLLEYFVCLTVPLFIKITIVFWGAYTVFLDHWSIYQGFSVRYQSGSLHVLRTLYVCNNHPHSSTFLLENVDTDRSSNFE